MNDLPYSVIAGRALKKILALYDLTQQEFAFDYGCDVRTVSRYINSGITKIQDIEYIANFFDIPFLEFFKYGLE